MASADETSSLYEARLEDDAARAAREERRRRIRVALGGMAPGQRRQGDAVDDGYEYVTVGELLRRAWDATEDYRVFVITLIFAALAWLVIAIGRASANLMVFVAFVAMVLLSATLVYMRWRELQDAREALERAEMIYNAAKEAERRQGKGKAQVRSEEE